MANTIINGKKYQYITDAEPTGRVIPYSEEWAMNAIDADGNNVVLRWLFSDSETVNDNGEKMLAEDLPWKEIEATDAFSIELVNE